MAGSIYAWSTTPATNATADGDINWAEFQDPDTVNNSARQMMARIAEYGGDTWGSRLSTGAANIYTVTSTSVPTALVDGLVVGFTPHQDNTDDCYLALNSFGNIRMRPANAIAFHAGDIKANIPIIATYRAASNEFIVRSNTGYFVNALGPTLFASNTYGLKVGDIKLSLASTPDAGFIRLTDTQQTLTKASYPDLNTWASGQSYPWGSAALTFNIPAAAGYFLRFGGAAGTAVDPRGTIGPGVTQSGSIGSHTHTFSATTGTESQAHTHSYGGNTTTPGGGAPSIFGTTGGSYTTSNNSVQHTHDVSGTTAATGGNETRPVNVTMYADILAVPALVSSELIGVNGMAYKFSSGTGGGNPGTGYFALNNATPASATSMTLSETDLNGVSFASIVQAWGTATQLIITKVGAPGNCITLQISSAITDAGLYDSFSISTVTATGTISNNDKVSIVAIRASGTLGNLVLSAGTASVAPLTFTSGSNLTTAAAGACEFDGFQFCATAVASSRQAIITKQYTWLTANYALTDTASAQKAFNASTNGAVTLAAGTDYGIEGCYYITNTGTVSHTWGILFGGTATITAAGTMLLGTGYTATSNALTAASNIYISGASVSSVTVLTAASVSATENVVMRFRGRININAAGTLIPQVKLSTASGVAATMLAGSYIELWPLGAAATSTRGNWS